MSFHFLDSFGKQSWGQKARQDFLFHLFAPQLVFSLLISWKSALLINRCDSRYTLASLIAPSTFMRILFIYLSWTLINACRGFTHTLMHAPPTPSHEYTSLFKWHGIAIVFSSAFTRSLWLKSCLWPTAPRWESLWWVKGLGKRGFWSCLGTGWICNARCLQASGFSVNLLFQLVLVPHNFKKGIYLAPTPSLL